MGWILRRIRRTWICFAARCSGDHAPENVVLLEIDPQNQKTLPDFLLTEKMLGIKTVCITHVEKRGRRLFYDGVPIERIYNRVIVDELVRKKVDTPFDYRDDLDVEWAGHPNWYFRISKFSIPFLKHPSVPRTRFLSEERSGRSAKLGAEAAVFVRGAGRGDRAVARKTSRALPTGRSTFCRSGWISRPWSRRRMGPPKPKFG